MTESTRSLSCWIEGFLDYTEGLALPRIIRLWSGITAFAGLLERRVWTTTIRGPLYPNLFVLIVTPPGIGKSLIVDPVTRIWRKTGDLHVAPDNMSKAAFLDVLQASTRRHILPNEILEYHSLQIAASEFGVLCPANDLEYLSVLTSVYDCRDNYRDFKRSREGNQIDISNPHINLLAATQPDYLSQFLNEAAWGQGFMARIILVYTDDIIKFDMFGEHKQNLEMRAKLDADAKLILRQIGNVTWTSEAQELFQRWVDAGGHPVPEHLKLKHYVVRRPFYILKLALISCVSQAHAEIEAGDVHRAIVWLTEAEASMPEIFKAMKGNSDYALLQELQLHVAQLSIANKGKPVHEARLIRFLAERTVSWNIPRILEAADKSGLIKKVVGGDGTEQWKPGEGQLGPET